MSASARKILETSIKVRHVIITGYSGNDYDLFPVIQASAKKTLSLLWLAQDPKSVTEEVVNLGSNISVYYGDLNTLFFSLCDIVGIRHSVESQRVLNSFEPSQMDRKLSRWAKKLNPMEIAYTLALFGMHIGMFELCETLCLALRRRKKHIGIFYPRILNVLGIVFKRRDPKKAMRYFRQAEKMAKPIRKNNPILYVNILGNLAALYHEQSRQKDALKALNRSTHWARKGKNRELLASNYDDKGNIERVSGRPEKALKYHLMAKKGRQEDGDLIGLGVTLNNLGLTYADLGKFDHALECLKESVRLRRKETGHTTGLARSLLNLGEVQVIQRKYRSAMGSIRESLRLSISLEDHVLICRNTYDIADLCARTGHLYWGRNFFLKAEKLAISIPSWSKDLYRMAWIETIRNRFSST